MGVVTEYLASLSGANRAALEHVREIVLELVPDASEFVSYAMPALGYRGKALISARETKKHLAIYPFSGRVLSHLDAELAGYSRAAGTLRFSTEHPVPDELLRRIIELRMAEIDASLDG